MSESEVFRVSVPSVEHLSENPFGQPAWSDSIPAMLSNGEYVIRASSVARYGLGMMNAINSGRIGNNNITASASVSRCHCENLRTWRPPSTTLSPSLRGRRSRD